MSFDEFDYADNCNDEKRMLDAELESKELKTLKDIKTFLSKDDPYINTYDKQIRREAVKWMKHLKNDEWEANQRGYSIIWIKHFFNISEEDLE